MKMQCKEQNYTMFITNLQLTTIQYQMPHSYFMANV